jgi:hypothetical protein
MHAKRRNTQSYTASFCVGAVYAAEPLRLAQESSSSHLAAGGIGAHVGSARCLCASSMDSTIDDPTRDGAPRTRELVTETFDPQELPRLSSECRSCTFQPSATWVCTKSGVVIVVGESMSGPAFFDLLYGRTPGSAPRVGFVSSA